MPASLRRALVATTSAVALAGAAAAPAAAATWGGSAEAARAAATPRIVGGQRIPVSTAPWQARITTSEGFLCGGSVIDAQRILTAAHCTFSEANAALAPGAFTVDTGTSGPTAAAGDARQTRAVASVRRHPYYRHPGSSGTNAQFADDAAVLTLAAPLDLSGPATQPVALAGAAPADGATGSVSGFGVQEEDSKARDGFLHGVGTRVTDPASVGPTNAVSVQANSSSGSSCFGDSGGPLVSGGTQIGIVSLGVRCGARTSDVYTSVGAPEIRQFVDGNDAPPRAPRGGTDPSLRAASSTLRPGSRVTCSAGDWTGEPTYGYTFRNGVAGTALAAGTSRSYAVRVSDVGRRISCQGAATNAGGTGRSLPTEPAPAVRKALRPSFSVTASRSAPRRGSSLRLTLRAKSRTAATSRNVRLCARVSSRYRVTSRSSGGKTSRGQLCWTVRSLGGRKAVRRSFVARLDRGGRAGALRTRATARATGVSTASASRTVRVRG